MTPPKRQTKRPTISKVLRGFFSQRALNTVRTITSMIEFAAQTAPVSPLIKARAMSNFAKTSIAELMKPYINLSFSKRTIG